jgi:hypothetical protein
LPSQPAAEHSQVKICDRTGTERGRVIEQADDIADISPDRVRGPIALQRQKELEVIDGSAHPIRHRVQHRGHRSGSGQLP